MSPFWRAFLGSFLGKIAGAIFIAVCVAMWLGPEEWVKWIVSDLPAYFTPAVARWVFLGLGLFVFFCMVYPLIPRLAPESKKKSTNSELVQDQGEKDGDADISLRDAHRYAISETTLLKKVDEAVRGLKIISEIQSVLESGHLRCWGRKKHSPDYEQIARHYWKTSVIDIDDLMRPGGSEGRSTRRDLSVETVDYEGLLLDRREVATLWPKVVSPRQPTSRYLDEISYLRTAETTHRNRVLTDQNQFPTWKTQFHTLRNEIREIIEANVSAAKAEAFNTVGNLQHRWTGGLNDEHNLLLSIATRDLDWLEEFIAEQSRR